MIVVDTSVIFKWYSDEAESSTALKILESHLSEKETICVPDLLLYKLTNAWATKRALPFEKIKLNLKNLQKIGISFEPINFKRANKAVEISKKYEVSVYGASYVVLAKEKKCKLYTADAKFVSLVNLPFVKNLADYS